MNRYKLLLVVVGVALIVSILPGCGGPPGEPAIATEVLKMLPEDTAGFIYVDAERFQADADLSDLHDIWREYFDPPGRYRHPAPDMKWWLMTRMSYPLDQPFIVCGGLRDVQAARDALAGDGCERKEQNGMEWWDCGPGRYARFSGDAILFGGNLGAYLGAIDGSIASLGDDSDIVELIDRVPAGFFAAAGDAQQWPVPSWTATWLAGSVAKKDAGTLSVYCIVQYPDPDTAADGRDDWEEAFALLYDDQHWRWADENLARYIDIIRGTLSNFTTRQTGRYVEISADVDNEMVTGIFGPIVYD